MGKLHEIIEEFSAVFSHCRQFFIYHISYPLFSL